MRANGSKLQQANLEKRRPLFFVFGSTTALFLTIVDLEWTAPVGRFPGFSSELALAEEVDWTIPVTVTRSPKLPAKAEKAIRAIKSLPDAVEPAKRHGTYSNYSCVIPVSFER